MLELVFKSREYFDDETNGFVYSEAATAKLEHSLYSIAAWESKWEKPFLGKDEKTTEELLDYIRLMVVSGSLPNDLTVAMTDEHMVQVSDYINARMTATWFSGSGGPPSREIITSEIVYYWMISLQIPMECEHWHFSRLITLIQVCQQKNNPKKMSRRESASRQRELNALRRSKFDTKG